MAKTIKKETSIVPIRPIQVRMVGFANGLTTYENVQLVRIISEKYSILIMAGHVPVIGQLSGDIEIVLKNEVKHIENIEAFYMHRADMLSILIRDC